MKKILISYADDNMAYSLKRLGKEAAKINVFDSIKLYTPRDLPEYIIESPLMKYRIGGGYWAWKPAIIWEALQEFGNDCLIIYLDAGCAVNKSKEWDLWFQLLEKYDSICFQYKDCMPEWEQFGQTSTLIKYWSKDSTVSFFHDWMKTDYQNKFNKIFGGAIIVKNHENKFVKSWLDITLNYPDLIMNPSTQELLEGNHNLAFHKHDQAIITPLAHFFKDSVLVLTESCETQTGGAIVAARIRAKTYYDYFKLLAKDKIRNCIGDNLYKSIKSKILVK